MKQRISFIKFCAFKYSTRSDFCRHYVFGHHKLNRRLCSFQQCPTQITANWCTAASGQRQWSHLSVEMKKEKKKRLVPCLPEAEPGKSNIKWTKKSEWQAVVLDNCDKWSFKWSTANASPVDSGRQPKKKKKNSCALICLDKQLAERTLGQARHTFSKRFAHFRLTNSLFDQQMTIIECNWRQYNFVGL